jgi:hypothetical protein
MIGPPSLGDDSDSDSDTDTDTDIDVQPSSKDSGTPQGTPDPTGKGNEGLDASMPPRDAGTPVLDAGTPKPPMPAMDAGPRDAGVPTVRDTGVPVAVPDTGTPMMPGPVDAGLSCVPGTYKGVFAGDISALLGIIKREVSGTISIDIALSGSASRLEIRNGTLSGKDSMGFPVRAVVSGTLNCETKRLENGRLTEGVYEGNDPITNRPSTTQFSGTCTANYTTDPPSASGGWDVQNRLGTRGGEGTWSATLVK